MSNEANTSVARAAQNKLRPGTPREFICVVGGCSNTFNGWFFAAQRSHDPNDNGLASPSQEVAVAFGAVPPRTFRDLDYYVSFPHARSKTRDEAIERKKKPGLDARRFNLSAIPPDKDESPLSIPPDADERRKKGLSNENVQRFIELGWKNVDFWVFPTGTHDIYWGNFVDTAARLYAGGTPWTPPLQRPEPKPGDIVTFLVFWPAYEKRMKIDWESSPYNQAYWKNFQAMKYWHTEWMHLRDKSPNLSAGSEDAHQDEQRRQEARKFRAENADKPLTEQELNFYILMRTAGENENGYIKRPDYFDAYLRYLHDSLLRCVAQPGVLTKILLFSTAQQVVDTLVKGLGAAISGIRIAGT